MFLNDYLYLFMYISRRAWVGIYCSDTGATICLVSIFLCIKAIGFCPGAWFAPFYSNGFLSIFSTFCRTGPKHIDKSISITTAPQLPPQGNATWCQFIFFFLLAKSLSVYIFWTSQTQIPMGERNASRNVEEIYLYISFTHISYTCDDEWVFYAVNASNKRKLNFSPTRSKQVANRNL